MTPSDSVARCHLRNSRECPDQAIFVLASTYKELGGFKDWPLLEDYEMVRAGIFRIDQGLLACIRIFWNMVGVYIPPTTQQAR